MSCPQRESLAELVSKFRRRLNLTQEELAGRSGLSTRTIQDLEAGRIHVPHRDTVQRLMSALDLSPAESTQLEAVVFEARALRRARAIRSLGASSQGQPGVQRGRIPITGGLAERSLLASRKLGLVIVGAAVVIGLLFQLLAGPKCAAPHLEGVTLYELPCYEGRSLTLFESDLELCHNPIDPAQSKVEPCFSAPSWNDVASSAWIGPGLRVELHLHNPSAADDAMVLFECNRALPDFRKLRFSGGEPVDNNVSRVVIQKTTCGSL